MLPTKKYRQELLAAGDVSSTGSTYATYNTTGGWFSATEGDSGIEHNKITIAGDTPELVLAQKGITVNLEELSYTVNAFKDLFCVIVPDTEKMKKYPTLENAYLEDCAQYHKLKAAKKMYNDILSTVDEE